MNYNLWKRLVIYCREEDCLERILIIGGNGCEKTTLAQRLASKLEISLIHLDMLYWRDNWDRASKDEFDDLLLKELSKPKWIIDGNMNRKIL